MMDTRSTCEVSAFAIAIWLSFLMPWVDKEKWNAKISVVLFELGETNSRARASAWETITTKCLRSSKALRAYLHRKLPRGRYDHGLHSSYAPLFNPP